MEEEVGEGVRGPGSIWEIGIGICAQSSDPRGGRTGDENSSLEALWSVLGLCLHLPAWRKLGLS